MDANEEPLAFIRVYSRLITVYENGHSAPRQLLLQRDQKLPGLFTLLVIRLIAMRVGFRQNNRWQSTGRVTAKRQIPCWQFCRR